MIRVAVAGCQGKMGKALLSAIKKADDLTLTALTVSPSATPTPIDGITPVVDLASVISHFDILIDFTVPAATMAHLALCLSHRKAMVIGTTGLTEQQKAEIQRASQDLPIVLAPNTSIGMNVCFALLKKAAHILGAQAEMEIIEAHHSEKRDAPSGTALQMGEIMAQSQQKKLSDIAVFDRRNSGPRQNGTIGISSIRARDIVGEHTALFALQGESLEITHKATDRAAFAEGALRAAQWLAQKPAGLYTMQDVLGL